MNLQILSDQLLTQFKTKITNSLDVVIDSPDKIETPVDYFRFYNDDGHRFVKSKIKAHQITKAPPEKDLYANLNRRDRLFNHRLE
jgi:hypothetical protein